MYQSSRLVVRSLKMMKESAHGDTLGFLTNAERAFGIAQALALILGSSWIIVLITVIATDFGMRNRYIVYSVALIFLFISLMTSARNLGVRLFSLTADVAEEISTQGVAASTRISLIRSNTLRDLLSDEEY